jgi:hypothetical protein
MALWCRAWFVVQTSELALSTSEVALAGGDMPLIKTKGLLRAKRCPPAYWLSLLSHYDLTTSDCQICN